MIFLIVQKVIILTTLQRAVLTGLYDLGCQPSLLIMLRYHLRNHNLLYRASPIHYSLESFYLIKNQSNQREILHLNIRMRVNLHLLTVLLYLIRSQQIIYLHTRRHRSIIIRSWLKREYRSLHHIQKEVIYLAVQIILTLH